MNPSLLFKDYTKMLLDAGVIDQHAYEKIVYLIDLQEGKAAGQLK